MIRRTADAPALPEPTESHPTARLNADLPASAAGHAALASAVADHDVLGYAPFNLDDDLRFAERHAVLSERDGVAFVTWTTGDQARTLRVDELESAKVDEAVGVDRITLRQRDGHVVELPYGREKKVKLAMSRLLHRIKKRVEHDTDPDLSPPPDEGEMTADLESARPAVLMRLLKVAQPYRWRIRAAMILTAAVGAVMVLPVWLMKYVIDGAINPQTTGGMTVGERMGSLIFWTSMFGLAVAAQASMFGIRLRLLSFVGTRVARDLREQVYAHLHKLSLRYFGKHRTGSLITRVTSDTDRLWDFIVFGSVDYARNVLMMVAATVVMFVVNWQLALIALAPVPFVAALTWWKSKVMIRKFTRLWTYWSRLTAVVGDTIPGVKVVKAFAAERRETDRFNRRNDAFSDDEYETIKVWVSLQPIVMVTMMFSRALILFAGGWLIINSPAATSINDANTLGTLIMFLSVVNFYHMAIEDMVQKQRIVTRAATSAQRVFEVLDTPVEIEARGPEPHMPERIDGRVEFRDVSFSYDGTKPVLRHVDLAAEPGQMIGLCGHSGAGKSTFVNLVSRFYDVSDGAILVDGVDVRDYDLKWLRGRVGVVLQEPYLFYGTIADNIRYGRPDAELGEVVEAARAANAHDFIVGLPDGYDTIVGERGQSLSGGERQRVSIARAILENPKILILDEATSSVDTNTEKAIQQALDRLVSGRTTFAIAHRLSTLANADKIVVLDKGSIVEQGTHEELLDRPDGKYRALVDMQNRLHGNQIEDGETVEAE